MTQCDRAGRRAPRRPRPGSPGNRRAAAGTRDSRQDLHVVPHDIVREFQQRQRLFDRREGGHRVAHGLHSLPRPRPGGQFEAPRNQSGREGTVTPDAARLPRGDQPGQDAMGFDRRHQACIDQQGPVRCREPLGRQHGIVDLLNLLQMRANRREQGLLETRQPVDEAIATAGNRVGRASQRYGIQLKDLGVFINDYIHGDSSFRDTRHRCAARKPRAAVSARVTGRSTASCRAGGFDRKAAQGGRPPQLNLFVLVPHRRVFRRGR